MGLFGGLGRALKKVDWDRVSTGLSAAGAASHGEHAQAAQIWGQYGRNRQDQRELEAKTGAARATAATLKQRFPQMSDAEALAIAQGGAGDTLLAQQYQPQQDSEFTRTLKAANIDPASPQAQDLYARRASTMANPAPQMVMDPKTGAGRWLQPPAPGLPGTGPSADAAPASEDGFDYTPGPGGRANPANWRPSLSAQQAAPILGDASRSQAISPEDANRVRQSLGPNGQSAYEKWLRDNNIMIGGR